MNFIAFSLFCIGLLADICFSAPPTTIQKSDAPSYRLSDAVVPLEYKIELTPYFDGEKAFTFDGLVEIAIKINQANVKSITLHISKDIQIKKQIINKKKNKLDSTYVKPSIGIEDSTYDETTNKYTILLTEALVKKENYILLFEYVGQLQNDMNGFYRSSYEEDGEIKWLAATHLEAVHARKVFPCFDEPGFKASFRIIINRPQHYHAAISNMPIEDQDPIANNSVIREIFEKTPIMSTYLVAFIVSEFECRKNKNADFEVCSRPNAIEQTEYSFDIGQKLLAKYDKLFESKYSEQLPKMTMAAIPDYVSGATENWGLLTYREKSLLHEPKIATTMAKQLVATVIAHEQSHMWFGDLVTCNWWSDLWLNEGFARFYEYFGTAMVETEWGLDQQFVVDQVQNVFDSDSLEDSMPLSHDVNTPKEIANRFDSISYDKGASIIRMLQHTVGMDTFNVAIRNYLKTNAYKSVKPKQLFDAFKHEVKDELDIDAFMDAWIYKSGYPVLNVMLSNDRSSLHISQKRFLRNDMDHDDKTLYNVPITYATSQFNTDFLNTRPIVYLDIDEKTIELGEPIDWIVLNVQQTGYYRVNYDDVLWAAISNVLHTSHSSIHVLNRAQIIDDALNLARAEQLDYEKVLHTVTYLKNEIEYAPWKAAFRNFNFILNRFKLDEAHIFEKVISVLLNKAYEHLGFEHKDSDTHLDIYNRANILKYACQFGHEECINAARIEFEKIKNAEDNIQKDIVPVVYCSAVAHGIDADWDFLWKRFLDGNVASEQVTILESLGCARKSELIEKYLNLILTDQIRLQDKHAALVSTFTYQQNLDTVLDFVIKNHQKIRNIFGDSEVPTILSQIVGRATTPEQVKKVEEFVNENDLKSNEKLKIAMKNAHSNLDWAERNMITIKAFSEHFTNNAATNTISCIALLSSILVYLFQ